jgi:hypothetical protein
MPVRCSSSRGIVHQMHLPRCEKSWCVTRFRQRLNETTRATQSTVKLVSPSSDHDLAQPRRLNWCPRYHLHATLRSQRTFETSATLHPTDVAGVREWLGRAVVTAGAPSSSTSPLGSLEIRDPSADHRLRPSATMCPLCLGSVCPRSSVALCGRISSTRECFRRVSRADLSQ